MTALQIIINIVLILVSIVLVISVLLQEGNSQGLGAISGGAETFFGKANAKGLEGKLLKITKIAAAVFIVLAIVMTLITSHNTAGADTNVENNVEITENNTDTPSNEIPAVVPAE